MGDSIKVIGPSIGRNENKKYWKLSAMAITTIAYLAGIPLLVSGVGHLANPHLFLDSVFRYQILPVFLVPWVVAVFPALTGVVGISLIFRQHSAASLYLAAILFVIFCLAQFMQLITAGAPIDCGCFVWLAHETSFINVGVLAIACGLTFWAAYTSHCHETEKSQLTNP